jgi:non-homologous end joining protein Ku
MVYSICTFYHVYTVNASTQEEAENMVKNGVCEETGQKFLGENIIRSHETNKKEYLKTFDEMNDYLKHIDEDRKLSYISKLNK